MTTTISTGPKRIYPVKEAAEQLGISRTRLFELIKLGAIESTIIGRRRVVTAAAIDRYAAQIDQQSIADTTALGHSA